MNNIEFLDSNKLRNNLLRIALFVAAFESFSSFIHEQLKFFYIHGTKDKIDFPIRYKEKVHKKYKKEKGKTDYFYEDLSWFLDNKAISEQEFQFLLQIRELRGKFVHEMSTCIYNGISKELKDKHIELIRLYQKINDWWVKNIEISINSSFLTDIENTNVKNLEIVFLELLEKIAIENI